LVSQKKEASITKENIDIAYVAYYQSLDELREFYQNKLKDNNVINESKLRNPNELTSFDEVLHPEKQKWKYEVKLHEVDAVIWGNKAKEAERLGNLEGAKNAKAKSIISKQMAKKIIQAKRREQIVANAAEDDQKYIGQKAIGHNDFLKSMSELEEKQKKAKFLAHFLEHSAEMYVHHFNSQNKEKNQRPIKDQLEVLLTTNDEMTPKNWTTR